MSANGAGGLHGLPGDGYRLLDGPTEPSQLVPEFTNSPELIVGCDAGFLTKPQRQTAIGGGSAYHSRLTSAKQTCGLVIVFRWELNGCAVLPTKKRLR